VCLLVAGTIEGFISAGDYGLPVRLAASGISLCFLAVYLLSGAVYRRAGPVTGV
jgi:hypothetical protein